MELAGKVCLITGANSGIGRAASRALAHRGARVVLACRGKEKGEEAAREIRREAGSDKVDLLVMDLAELASVRAAASEFLATHETLDILVNNAGVAGSRGLTRDGFELAFGVNHLGHFLLTHLLLDALRAAAPARVVNVTSSAHYSPKKIPWDALRARTSSITGLSEYGVSKLANVLFTAELARRLDGTGVTTYAVHPGVIASDIWRRIPTPFRQLSKLFMGSNEVGAEAVVHCAAAPEVAQESGLYYAACAPKKPSRLARDRALAAELWRRSAAYCGLAAAGA